MAKKLYKIFLDRNNHIQMNTYKIVYSNELCYFLPHHDKKYLIAIDRNCVNPDTISADTIGLGIYFDYRPSECLAALQKSDKEGLFERFKLAKEYKECEKTHKVLCTKYYEIDKQMTTVSNRMSYLLSELHKDDGPYSLNLEDLVIDIKERTKYQNEDADNSDTENDT